jgi:O-antigen/teichoic acid export membrane protein
MVQEYKSILKATSIFGGTQVIQILVGLVRSKFVAILIGAAGMGLSSMYLSSLTMIITIFGLGINSSVVRDLSKAFDEHDMERFALIIKVFRRILYVLSIAGLLCVIAMSPFLSEWAFKSPNKALDYGFLSSIVFFTLLSQGNTALLVSQRKIKSTALCSLIGSIVTLLTSVPFFYFFGLNGVVPGLIVSTFADYLITYLFVRHIRLAECHIGRKEIISLGKPMIALGVAMVLASLLGNITTYLINLSITRLGGLSDLGLFNAGMSMTMQSITLVFSAMAADYYPRLVASFSDDKRMNDTINRQSEILLYLGVPILSVFMVASPLIITILLSPEFQVIKDFIRILCLGMLFKAASYALGYVSFAKGDKYIYVFLEGIYGNVFNFILSIGMYYLWGLIGLAYSFVINYVLYFIIISVVDKKRYHYARSKSLRKVLVYSILSLAVLLSFSYLLHGYVYYIVGCSFTAVIVFYNLKKLNEKTELIAYVKTKIRR